MPKTRHEVATAVAHQFIPTKKALTAAAAASYQTLATMLQERDRAGMEPEFAAQALALTRLAADAAFEAVQKIHEAHTQLAEIRTAWAVPPGAFGPDDTVKGDDASKPTLAFERKAA